MFLKVNLVVFLKIVYNVKFEFFKGGWIVMISEYFQIEKIESQQSIEKFNENVDQLYKMLEKKIKLENEAEFEKYYFCIKDKANKKHMTYLNLVQKDVSLLKARSSEITKIMNVFNRRINNEIKSNNHKSTEITLSILNETHSRVNRNIQKIEKTYNSFQPIKNAQSDRESFVYYVDSYKERESGEKNRTYNFDKFN